MTTALRQAVETPPRMDQARSWFGSPVALFTAVASANALLFLLVSPPVGDLWAARARQSAAAHGVGLGYWFSWFSGGSTPGNYSVLTPYLSGLVGAAILGALGTAAITPLTAVLVRGSAHPTAATAISALVAGLSLWSGRVPFAAGTSVSIMALIAVRAQRPAAAGTLAVLTALVSPVSAAFLAMGTGALFITSPRHRFITTTTVAATIVSLVSIEIIFGMPGPQPFSLLKALIVAAAVAVMLVARPAPYVRVVIVVAILACPLLAVLPNGMGSNFQRLVWICLPIAVVATGAARVGVVLAACAIPVFLATQTTVSDLWVSAQPMSSQHFYDSLAARLDRIPALSDYRLEVVPDGTHTAAYALLGHAMLARGYETQEDNAHNAILMSPRLDALSYKVWLDNNAVGFVAIGRKTLAANPEDTLIRRHRPTYLTQIWSDTHWLLLQVRYPSPVVPAPVKVIEVAQASMQLDAPRAGSYPVRIRWSTFLKVSATGPASATIANDGFGFTKLTVTTPGRFTLHA